MWKSFCLWCCWHLALICTVQGVRMSINPQSVVLGATPSVSQTKTTFTCDSPDGTNIDYIKGMKITRISRREGDGIKQTIVLLREGRGAEIPPTITDIQNRATATGSVDIANRNGAYVSLALDTVAMQCLDVGQYFCELDYDDIDGNSHQEGDSMNFTATALPISSGFTLTAKVNGVSYTSTSASSPVTMSEGQEIEFSCSGSTGGDPNTQIEWMKSGYSGLIKFVPSSYPNAVETRGDIQPDPDQCTNRRSTKLTYNITSSDRNANNGRLEFMCYAEVTYQGVTTQANSSIFYIQVGDGGSSDDGSPAPSSGSSAANAGAIAGGVIGAVVFIVIVVLLVYFLWYRRRGGGDTYKTREETDGSNPNLAPSAADLYSQPDKPRSSNESLEQTVKYGHENRGLDDHDRNNYHEKEKRGRHHRDDYDRDRRGHHNHGMDDDFESRDGGSGVHPSDGPIGTGV